MLQFNLKTSVEHEIFNNDLNIRSEDIQKKDHVDYNVFHRTPVFSDLALLRYMGDH